MAKKTKEIPVYFFAGFLESGKTSFILETLKEEQFQDGLKTVYILCEEGLEEIPGEILKKNRFIVREIENEEDMTEQLFLEIDKKDRPDRVVIEFNGTWDPDSLMEKLPDHWLIAEGITTIDASTYEDYLNNMKQMMTRQFTYADLVLFNRCSESMNLPSYKRTVRGLNRQAQILFEMTDGTVNNNVKEELPYDMNASEIRVEDDDFGIWYIDTFENLEAYIGKTVSFKGVVRKSIRGIPSDTFVPGRFAMTCCAEDIQFFGFPCRYEKTQELKEREYVNVTARIDKEMNKRFGQETPVLYAETVTPAEPPKEKVIYLI